MRDTYSEQLSRTDRRSKGPLGQYLDLCTWHQAWQKGGRKEEEQESRSRVKREPLETKRSKRFTGPLRPSGRHDYLSMGALLEQRWEYGVGVQDVHYKTSACATDDRGRSIPGGDPHQLDASDHRATRRPDGAEQCVQRSGHAHATPPGPRRRQPLSVVERPSLALTLTPS
eukprot:7389410-Prymnesium_polylepis.1